MTSCDHLGGAGLQTVEVRVPGANSPWCFNDAMDRVRQLDGVVDVRASIVGECIEVRHRDVPISLLVDTFRTYLHGTDDSSHERQMVGVEPQVASSCGCTRSTSLAGHRPEPARPMETLVEAMKRLRSSGYTHDFIASDDGNLACRACGTTQAPEHIEIRETVRFEGDSNPDDEAILFALACVDGDLGHTAQRSDPAPQRPT